MDRSETGKPDSLATSIADDNEQELIRLLRTRDPRAMDQLLARHGHRLIRLAWLLLGDGPGADDAVQETLIAAWDAGRRGAIQRSLSAWLTGTLINRCRKHRRSASRRRKRELTVQYFRCPAVDPSDSNDESILVEQMLQRLDESAREILILRYYQQLSVREAAKALGIPEGTVKSRCHAALAQLREMMGREMD